MATTTIYLKYNQLPEAFKLQWSYNVTSVNYVNLTSTITWQVLFSNQTSSAYSGTSLYISGSTVFGDSLTDWNKYVVASSYQKNIVIASGTATVKHAADGTNSGMEVWFSAANSYGSKSYSGTWTTPTITRYATINSIKNSSGETTLYEDESITIGYNNPAGSSVTSLDIGITDVGSDEMLVGYKTLSKTATSYSLSLSATDKQALYSYFTYSTSHEFRFVIKTVIGGVTYVEDYYATIFIRNYEPTLSPTVVDNNSDTLRLTGSNKTLVKYMSDAYYTIGASPVKGGLITEKFVRNIDTYYDATGTIPNVESNTFYFGATDSRGAVANKAIVFNNLADLKWVEYIKLTCAIKDVKFNTNGSLTITIAGKYFNGNFGAASNKLTIDYEVHAIDAAEGTWQTSGFITPSVDSSGNYTYSFSRTGFDYTKRYIVSVKASDELMATEVVSKTIASTPVFDWGENDFNFNVPVHIDGEPIADFVIETGTEAMGSNGIWYWEKWHSGKACCYGLRNYGNMAVTTGWGQLFYSTSAFTQNYPTGLFTQIPECKHIQVHYMDAPGGAWVIDSSATVPDKSQTGAFRVVCPTSTNLTQVRLSFDIKGRWK